VLGDQVVQPIDVEPGRRLDVELPGLREAADVAGLEAVSVLGPPPARARDLLGVDRDAVAPADQHRGGGGPAAHAGDLRDQRDLPVQIDRIGGRERGVDRGGDRGAEPQRVAPVGEPGLLGGIAEEADLGVAVRAARAEAAEHAQRAAPDHRRREPGGLREVIGHRAGEPLAGGLGAVVDPHRAALARRIGVGVEVDRDERVGPAGAGGGAAGVERDGAIVVAGQRRAVAERGEVIGGGARDRQRHVLLAGAAGADHAGAGGAAEPAGAAVARINDDGSHRPPRA